MKNGHSMRDPAGRKAGGPVVQTGIACFFTGILCPSYPHYTFSANGGSLCVQAHPAAVMLVRIMERYGVREPRSE